MKLVVVGGTGHVGSKLVEELDRQGHTVRTAALRTGVDTVADRGVDEAVAGMDALVDVSNAASWADDDAMRFFTTSTVNLLSAARAAGVAHYVVLSIVGADRLPGSGYLRAKAAQERLVTTSGTPFSILRATQLYELLPAIAEGSMIEGTVHLAPVHFQPVAADDVSLALSQLATAHPTSGIQELGGPHPFRMDELLREVLNRRDDPREIVVDPHATYFGAELGPDTLMPGPGAQLASTTYNMWCSDRLSQASYAGDRGRRSEL